MFRFCLVTMAVAIACCRFSGEVARAQTPAARETTTVAYREVNGHKILVDIDRPRDDVLRPVIVWIHGGALIMGHRQWIDQRVRKLATDKGYALVSIDYRLAPETKLPGLISDVEAAFAWLGDQGADQFGLDCNRMVVVGGSAGGYLTLVTGFRVRPRPRAVVTLFGYGDLHGDWYSQPSQHARHNKRKIERKEAEEQTDGKIVSDARTRKGNGSIIYNYYRQNGLWPLEVSGFASDQLARQIADYEPLQNVTSSYPPTLLIHGTSDTDVPYSQSDLMAKELRKHDVPHQLIPIKGGEHGFSGGDPSEIQAAYTAMGKFISRHIGDD